MEMVGHGIIEIFNHELSRRRRISEHKFLQIESYSRECRCWRMSVAT